MSRLLNYTLKTRAECERYLWTYTERHRIAKRSVITYKRRVAQLSKRIEYLRIYEQKVDKIAKSVEKFLLLEKRIKTSVSSRDQLMQLGKGLFSKYALENGIKSVDISCYVGAKTSDWAAVWRKRFTNSFSKNPTNKRTWDQFKEYIKEV